jgi:enamine deaminase RidA (YjgF/YER057c/UK114 family)
MNSASAQSFEQITTPAVPEPTGNIYSNCLRIGNQVILSGMTASEPVGDAYEQSMASLARVKALIEAAGGTLTDVANFTIYLTNIEDRPAFAKARAEYFSGRMPCSTLVEVSALGRPGLLVEIEAMAFLGAGR